MRIALVISASLLLASMVSGRCTIVTVGDPIALPSPQPSTQNVRIAVNLNGLPLSGANIAVYSGREHTLFYATADANGIIHLRKLNPGRYHIVATAAVSLRSDIVLDVSNRASPGATSLTMDISTKSPPDSLDEQNLAATGRMPVTERVSVFNGEIDDALGAVITTAKVHIFPNGSWDESKSIEITADAAGRFLTNLPAGTYRAVAVAPGFRANFVIFEIVPNGATKDLRVVLQVADCSYSTRGILTK